jgi:hypothetical protein
MPIRSVSDVLEAHGAGRVHTQRFLKNSGTTGDGQWHDWSYASGQPGYDARIGVAGQFNPFVAVKNDAIYFPPIEAGQERHLTDITLTTIASGTNQSSVDAVLYDILGVYPLIDGDNTDQQSFDNTLTLPRYSSGEGVFPVLVNHVAPVLAVANGTMNYINSIGNPKSVAIRVVNTGQNKVCSAVPDSSSAAALVMPLASGCRGARSVTSVTFTQPPGGLMCIYLMRSLATITNLDGRLVADKIFTEKSLLTQNGWSMPRIYDGAHLGFFVRPNGGGRSFTMFGTLTFVWG